MCNNRTLLLKHKFLISASIALSFLGWLLLMVLVLLEEHTNVPQSPMVSHHPCQGCLHLTLKIVGIFVPFAILVFLAGACLSVSNFHVLIIIYSIIIICCHHYLFNIFFWLYCLNLMKHCAVCMYL